MTFLILLHKIPASFLENQESSDFPRFALYYHQCLDHGDMYEDVLEHLWDPMAVLLLLRRFVKKNGIIAFSTPNIGALTAQLMGKYWALMTVPEHLCFFDKNTVKLLNSKVGLETTGWITKGTWSNVAFLIYKFLRVIPVPLPAGFMDWVKKSSLSKWVVYIPTGDIQFCVARKK